MNQTKPIEFYQDPEIKALRNKIASLEARLALYRRAEELEIELERRNTRNSVLLDAITKAVSDEFCVGPNLLRSRSRAEQIAIPRQVAMALAYEIGNKDGCLSLEEIGRYWNRDHGTVIHAGKATSSRYATNYAFQLRVERARKKIKLNGGCE